MASSPFDRVGEVLLQPDRVDEVEVGCENLLRRAAVEYADEQRDDALGDDGIAVGRIVDLAPFEPCVDPNPRLTAVDEVAVGAVRRVDRRQCVAQFDQIVVFVEPVVEDRELADDFVLNLIHWLNLLFSEFFQNRALEAAGSGMSSR